MSQFVEYLRTLLAKKPVATGSCAQCGVSVPSLSGSLCPRCTQDAQYRAAEAARPLVQCEARGTLPDCFRCPHAVPHKRQLASPFEYCSSGRNWTQCSDRIKQKVMCNEVCDEGAQRGCE
jgi:hypothetical protein